MQIVLIIPPSPWLISDTDLPFLGILYIAASLKNFGFDVTVCDLSGLDEKSWKIPCGDIYGITGASPNFPQMKRIAEILKAREPDKLIIAGGPHATLLPEHLLKNSSVDICVIGEGEDTVFDLIYENDLSKVKGIVFRKGDSFVRTAPRGLTADIDAFPSPGLEAIDFYRYAKSQTFKYLLGDCREATVLTARGCPYNCSFCAQNAIWQGKVRQHSIDRVINEIAYLKKRFGVNLIYILDDTFILNKKRVYEFCQKIKDVGIYWHCLNRVDCCDYDLMVEMKNSGCLQVVFGFESGSDRILSLMNKKTTVSQGYEAIRICKQAGLKIRGQMIFGFPGEDAETVEETAEFIKQADVDTFGLHRFQPYPGCDVWNNPQKYHYVIDKDTDFSTYHTIGTPDITLSPNGKYDSENDCSFESMFDYLRDVIGEKNIEKHGALD